MKCNNCMQDVTFPEHAQDSVAVTALKIGDELYVSSSYCQACCLREYSRIPRILDEK